MRALIIASLLAIGCQGEDYDRAVFEEDGFSVAKLSGWAADRERGTVVLRADGESATLAVRSMPLDLQKPEPSLDEMASATKTVLSSLREADVAGPEPMDHARLRAAEFWVGFETSDGRKLERRHIVLLGSAHLFHAFHTAPAGQLSETAPAFTTLVSSLREYHN